MKRRILAIFMMVAMIITMVPIVALAGPSGLTISLVKPVITMVAETNGYWITDENSNTYYKYNMPSDGFTFVVEDNNMLVDQYSGYSFSMGEDNFFFAFNWGDGQTYENKWEKGGTYYVPVDLVCPNDPSKNEPEIVSIEVNIISLVDDINITSPIVGLVGEPNYLNFDYSIEFNPAIIDSINIMNGGRSFIYDLRHYFVELDRSKIDFNTPGVYTTTASVAGCSKEVEVTINPAPITDFSVDDVLLYQYVDGYYEIDINGDVWFYYFLRNPNILSVVAPNNDVSIVEEEGAWSNSVLYENKTYFANIDSISPMNEDADHELVLGKTPVKAKLFGIEKDTNINVVESEGKDKISEIIVNDVEIAPGQEMWQGNLIDMEVLYKDGSIGYNTDSSYLDSNGNVVPIGVFYENGDEPYSPDGWGVGTTHKVTLYFLGNSYTYNVTIRDDGVQSAELINKNLQRPKGVYLDKILADEDVEITYKNGDTEVKKYSELEGISYVEPWGDPLVYILNYGGVSSEFTVEDVETITKIELDSDSVGKAYWNGQRYEYTPSGLTATFFYDDGTSEVVENIGWSSTLEHDGYIYNLNCATNGIPNPNNNTLEVYVGVSIYDTFEVVSNTVPVGIEDSSIGVKNIKLLSAPTSKHYIGDTFFSSCIGEEKFKPYDFTGLEIEVEMDDGEKFVLYGDDITNFNGDSPTYLLSGNSSGHRWIIGFTNQTKTSADLSVWVLGERVDNLCTIKREPSPYKSIEIVSCPSDSQLDNCDATGLQFKVTTNDGKSEIITLGAPLPGDGKFGAYVMTGGQSIDAPYVGGGDGGILFVPVDGVPGIRYNAYSIGGNQYVSIVWNNGILRFADQMVVINPDKYTTINGNVEVDIDNDELSKAIIDSLPIDKRYAVEQQGAPIFNNIDADEVDATDKITVKANEDDTDIKSCYDINFSYLVQGNEYQLTELPNGKIAVTVPLDESLWGLSKDKIVIYREHQYADGVKVEQITDFTISDDGKFITFESDKFSTFALGYKDKKDVPPGGNGGTNNEKPTLPETVEKIANTLDNTPIAATMMLVCSSGLCLFAVARKRKELE